MSPDLLIFKNNSKRSQPAAAPAGIGSAMPSGKNNRNFAGDPTVQTHVPPGGYLAGQASCIGDR